MCMIPNHCRSRRIPSETWTMLFRRRTSVQRRKNSMKHVAVGLLRMLWHSSKADPETCLGHDGCAVRDCHLWSGPSEVSATWAWVGSAGLED